VRFKRRVKQKHSKNKRLLAAGWARTKAGAGRYARPTV
jgi:hypothetical protein